MQVVALSLPVLRTPYKGQVTEMIPSSYTIPIAFVRSPSGPAQYHQTDRAHATNLIALTSQTFFEKSRHCQLAQPVNSVRKALPSNP
jgi:hypothetical protein